MRIFLAYILGAFLAGLFGISDAVGQEISVDQLSKSPVGSFPTGWKSYPFYSGKAHRVYQVQSDGSGKFIQARDSEDISVPIFTDFDWDIEKFPYLKYRWRAQKLPSGARESSRATNDSACGVSVGFGRTSALKYVWSSTLPIGSFWEKEPGKMVIIAKASGSGKAGTWQNVTIEVPKDYREYFRREESKAPSGIGIMTDGNAVHQPAECDYADFRLSASR